MPESAQATSVAYSENTNRETLPQFELVCSNKPRPSVQKGAKGNQHWRRDVHHARRPGRKFTLCYVETSDWLMIESAFSADDPHLCRHCARVASSELSKLTAA